MWKVVGLASASALCACLGGDDGACDVPNTICTVAGHTTERSFGGDGGPAIAAGFDIPVDMTVAPDGSLWVIDFNNYRIRRIDHGVIDTVVGTGLLGDSPAQEGLASIPALASSNNHMTSMAFANGDVYLAAWHESRIKRVHLADMTMDIVGGRGVRTYYDGDGGPFAAAALDLPSSIAFQPDGQLVFTDEGNHVVRAVDETGTIHTIVGRCVIEPQDVGCVAPVACPGSEKVVCGDVSFCNVGTQGSATCANESGGDGGLASDARLGLYQFGGDFGGRIAYDRNGDLLITEADTNCIRKVDHVTNVITTIAGTGTRGYSGDGGLAIDAQIDHPVDLAVAPDNTIYFTDTYNHCVRKIDPSGVISSVAGTCHVSVNGEGGDYAGDGGPALAAQLNRPYGLELAGSKLYIADSYNNRVRVVNLPLATAR